MSEGSGRAEMERRIVQRSIEDDAFRQQVARRPQERRWSKSSAPSFPRGSGFRWSRRRPTPSTWCSRLPPEAGGDRGSSRTASSSRWPAAGIWVRPPSTPEPFAAKSGTVRPNASRTVPDFQASVCHGWIRADWFLRSMGLESFPAYRDGGRLQNYRGRPPLSEGAFGCCRRWSNTAENLRRASDGLGFLPGSPGERAGMLLALCSFRLEDLAAPDAPAVVSEAVRREAGRFRDKTDHTPRAEDFSSS